MWHKKTKQQVVAIAITGCGEKKDNQPKEVTLVGSWKYEGLDCTYVFNANGTGSYTAFGNKREFTYKTEGNKISILYTGDTLPFETEYSINGDTLNVIDSLGDDTLYKRVK